MARTAESPRAARLRSPAVLGVLSALVAVLAYGVSQVLVRRLFTTGVPPQVGATLTLFFGMLYLFLISLPRLSTDLKAPRRSLLFVCLAGIAASIGVLCNYIALSLAPVVIVSPITTINPLVTLVLSAIFLRQMERVTPRLVLGAVLVVGGVLLVIIGSNL